jgi:hypothetical protein
MGDYWILWAVSIFVMITIIASYLIEKQKAAEFRAVAESLGSNVEVKAGGFIGNAQIRFERAGTEINGTVRQLKHSCDFVATINLPPSSIHFHIRSKAALASTYLFSKPIPELSAHWKPVVSPHLLETHLTYSHRPEHLTALLNDPKIIDEIMKYDITDGRFIDIWLENGRFELMYHADGQYAREKMRDVFETAIAFHDHLKVLTAQQEML